MGNRDCSTGFGQVYDYWVLGPLGKEIEYGFGYVIYWGTTGIMEKMEATSIFGLLRECGFGYIIIRSPYTPCFIYLRRTIAPKTLNPGMCDAALRVSGPVSIPYPNPETLKPINPINPVNPKPKA